MPKSSYVDGLVAGVMLAVFTLVLVAVFLKAWDEPEDRKRDIEASGFYVAGVLLVGVPFLNALYIVARKRLR
jgi:multisubunit Na+/H+ antiporter MnhB subunit